MNARLSLCLRGVCLVAICAIASSADAQATGDADATVALLRIEACDEALHLGIRAAMELEVGAGLTLVEVEPPTGTNVRFHVVAPCSDASFVELEDDSTGLVVRRSVVLADTSSDLLPRMLALVAHELARLDRNARATRLTRFEPAMMLEPMWDDADVAPSSHGTHDASPSERASRSRAVAFGVDAVARVFVQSPVVLGGVRLGTSVKRLTVGLRVLGGRRSVEEGALGVLSTTLDVGVRLWPKDVSRSPFSLGVRGEAGLVRTVGRPGATAIVQGTRSLTPVVGGSLDAALTLAMRDVDAALRVDLEIGAMTGPRVMSASNGAPDGHTTDVAGVFVSLAIGMQF